MGKRFCLVCKNRQTYPICKSCSKDPFKVEDVRQNLAEINQQITLLRMYDRGLAQLRNLNNSKFWDKKLSKAEDIKRQDGMTKDRIATAVSYVPNSAKRILDIGAGHGFLEVILVNRRPDLKINGIDISSKAINLLQKRFQGEFVVGTACKIPYPDNCFDVIFALELLEHVSPYKVFDVLREIRRVLVPMGSFILSVPLNEGLRYKNDNPSGHVREYSSELILKELEIAGFQRVESKLLFAFSNSYKFKKLIQNALRFRWKPNDIVIKSFKL